MRTRRQDSQYARRIGIMRQRRTAFGVEPDADRIDGGLQAASQHQLQTRLTFDLDPAAIFQTIQHIRLILTGFKLCSDLQNGVNSQIGCADLSVRQEALRVAAMILFRCFAIFCLSLSLMASPVLAAVKTTAHTTSKTSHATTKKTGAKKTSARGEATHKPGSVKTGRKAKTSSSKKTTSGKTTKKTTKKTAKKTTPKIDPRARTEAMLRQKTDDFVTLIDGGKQSLTDARIAWSARHPEVACQRARAAKTQFGKARGVLDDMIRTAQDGKADTAPLKALYPKTDELDDTTRKLIGMTCTP